MKIRRICRWIVLLAVCAFTVFQIVDMKHAYREWQESKRIGDRSGADFYATNLQVDRVEILGVWGIAAALLFIFRPKRPVQ